MTAEWQLTRAVASLYIKLEPAKGSIFNIMMIKNANTPLTKKLIYTVQHIDSAKFTRWTHVITRFEHANHMSRHIPHVSTSACTLVSHVIHM